ncbi:Hypothetical predicted protein [Pelobates cultripes]|uniref:Uncharacterized protein n=1 Tax=Pelobates cultripes TaxID=61616 RepID=A0AAD1S8M3_PELCU|nr:Hypothetical predicted protein [Pelobates cultripes]
MEKKTLKSRQERSEGSRDIWDLLRTRPQPKMAAPLQRSPSCSSGELEYDAPDHILEARASVAKKERGATEVDADSAPTTKDDLKHLLQDLRTMFQTDCALIREDMHTLSGHIKSVEDEAVTARQTHLDAALLTQQLTQQHAALARQVAGLEYTQLHHAAKICLCSWTGMSVNPKVPYMGVD